MGKKIIRFLIELLVASVLAVAGISLVIMASIQETTRLNSETYVERG